MKCPTCLCDQGTIKDACNRMLCANCLSPIPPKTDERCERCNCRCEGLFLLFGKHVCWSCRQEVSTVATEGALGTQSDKQGHALKSSPNGFVKTPDEVHADYFLSLVFAELQRARVKHPQNHADAHHSYAIIKEELEEYWDEVKKQDAAHDPELMLTELVQVAAMSCRAYVDVIRHKIV